MNGISKCAKILDLEVSNDAEQNKKIKSKKKIFTSASISENILDAVMDCLLSVGLLTDH